VINLTLATSGPSTARVWSKCGNCQCRIGPGRRYHIVRYPDSLLKPFCSACVSEIVPTQESAPTAPGSGHTGAVNTECEATNKKNQGEAPAAGEFGPICWTMDDLEVTWKELDKSAVLALFAPEGFPETEWQDLPRGRNGYRTGVVRGFIRVYWDGGADMAEAGADTEVAAAQEEHQGDGESDQGAGNPPGPRVEKEFPHTPNISTWRTTSSSGACSGI